VIQPPLHLRLRDKLDRTTERLALRATLTATHLLEPTQRSAQRLVVGGIHHRFASADNIKATARLERFWRSLKEMAGLRGLQLALTVDDLERRIEIALLHYLCFRPHEGLGGATPVEVFLGLEPAHLSAVEPPRGMPSEDRGDAPFRLVFLDESSRRFPVLTQAG